MATTGVAVVTGAGSGMGRVVARALLDAGWRVALAGRREQALHDSVTPGAGGRRRAGRADGRRRPEAVAACSRRSRSGGGGWTCWSTTRARFGPGGAVDEIPVEGWQPTVATNLTGSFLCAHHAVRMMKAQDPQGGRIINNGSISAHTPRPGSVGYTATKHAITGLTKSISLDGRPYGIACGQIDIGNAATDMTPGIATACPQADGSVRPEPTFDAGTSPMRCCFMAGLPLDANVQFLTITATTMPFIGRG